MARLKPRSKALDTSSVQAQLRALGDAASRLCPAAARDPRLEPRRRATTGCTRSSTTAIAPSPPSAGGRCRIYTRSGQDWTEKFASIAAPLRQLKVGSALLDGEIVALDDDGRLELPAAAERGLKEGSIPLTYYVFDILELDGRDLRDEPLTRRKEILRKLLQGAPDAIRYSEDVVGHGDKVLAQACRLGLEGIVSKQADKPYVSRRAPSWLKIKCLGNEEFVIGGYRVSDKKGRSFASLLLGEFEGGKLHYRGRVGTGFDSDYAR